MDDRIRKSLDISWKEGIFGNIMLVMMDYYLIPLALFLGASTKEIGFVVAVPHLVGSISQLVAARIVKKMGSRLSFIIKGALIQAACLLPLGLLFFIPFSAKIQILIVLAAIFRTLANLIGTAWGSLVSEYLPPSHRGHYFGWRSQVTGIAGILALAVAGVALSIAKRHALEYGFLILFITTALCRFICAYMFRYMTDLPHEEKETDYFTFIDFIKRFRESNFVKYVLYVASISFATQLAAPYFSVYMLENLHFDYIRYISIHLTAITAGLVGFPIWGKHADHVGNAKVLKTTSFLVPIIPFLWLASSNFYYLILVEAFAGFVWGGFNLATANFVFDAASPSKRIRCLGYFNLLNGIAIFFGASLGGFLSDKLPPLFGFRLMSLFVLSGILRFAAHFLLSGGFREVRAEVKPVSSLNLFFSVLGMRPLVGLNREFHVMPFFSKSKKTIL